MFYSPSVTSLVEFTFNRVTKQLSICRVAMSHRIVSSSGFRNNTNNNRWHQQTFCAFSAAKPALHLAWLLLLDLPLPLPPASAPCLSVVGRWCETTVFVRTSTLWPFLCRSRALDSTRQKNFISIRLKMSRKWRSKSINWVASRYMETTG